MASKAISGRGTVVSIGAVTGTTGTETFTVIGEVMSASRSGTSRATDDVSNFDSSGEEEFITTMRNNGEVSLSFNRISGDAGQVAMKTAWDSGAKYDFKIQYPKGPSQTTTGDVDAFSAAVTAWDTTVDTKSGIKASAKLKVSGAVVTTVGS